MSIDRIGKGPGSLPVPDAKAPSVTGTAGPDRAFEVGKSQAAGVEAAASISPAERVRGGELDLDAYLSQRAQEATRHLEGKLPASDLAHIQATLRAQLASDPTLIEMVRAATGKTPTSPEE